MHPTRPLYGARGWFVQLVAAVPDTPAGAPQLPGSDLSRYLGF